MEDDPEAVSSFQREESTLQFPRIQGADIVGQIVSVGSGIPKKRIGERVLVDFSIYNGGDGDRSDMDCANMDYIGNGRDGGFAEYATVPADQARPISSKKSDVELATFCCAYMTAEHMLERARVLSGERVLVTGASGGVGSAVIQLCRTRGAIPFALSSIEKERALLEIGASSVISKDAGNLVAAVQKAAGGWPLDVVVDVVAGPIFGDLLQLLRPEGRYVTCGAIAGPLVEMDLRSVYLKHLDLKGSSQGNRADFDRVVHLIESDKLKALVGGVYKLSDLHRAQADFLAKKFIGKLVVVPDAKWSETDRRL